MKHEILKVLGLRALTGGVYELSLSGARVRSFFVPSPTVFISRVRVPSASLSATLIGRRRKNPGTESSTNCPARITLAPASFNSNTVPLRSRQEMTESLSCFISRGC